MQSLEDIPELFADYLDISVESGQIILSVVVLLAVLLPVMYLAKGKRALSIEIVMIFVVMCLLVGINWLPYWILIATVAVLALAWAKFGSDLVTGGD